MTRHRLYGIDRLVELTPIVNQLKLHEKEILETQNSRYDHLIYPYTLSNWRWNFGKIHSEKHREDNVLWQMTEQVSFPSKFPKIDRKGWLWWTEYPVSIFICIDKTHM